MNTKVIHIIPKGSPMKIHGETYHELKCYDNIHFFMLAEYALVDKSLIVEYILQNDNATYVTFEDVKAISKYLIYVVRLCDGNVKMEREKKFVDDVKKAKSFDDLLLNDCALWFLNMVQKAFLQYVNGAKFDDDFKVWYEKVLPRFAEGM